MIQELKVKGLNNRFNYNLQFNKDLNIFTGVNGSGKTTLLKLIWYLISGKLHRIVDEIPFESISIITEPFSLNMTSSVSGKSEIIVVDYRFSGRAGSELKIAKQRFNPHKNGSVRELNRRTSLSSQNSLFFPTFRRIEGGFSIGSKEFEQNDDSSLMTLLNSPTAMLHTALSAISEQMSTNKHKFIASISTADIVELLPQKHTEISDAVNELYARLSGGLSKRIPTDTEFKQNKFTHEHLTSILKEIREEFTEADKKQKQLRKPLTVLDEYVQIIFQDLGIHIAEDIRFGETEDAISSDKLSSGEKQMLSFLCYNAFSKNTAIFIDEPELSLHQDWEDILLPVLLKQETGNQLFVATHSESIYIQFSDKEFILNLEGN